jgi:FkbM family methyltransferase
VTPGGSSRIFINSARNDLWVRDIVFPGVRNGFFVEAGAADGVHDSSCFLLERQLGWTGLCIEPSPQFFASLVRNRPRSTCENVCLAAEEKEVTFILGQSGFCSGVKDNLLSSKWRGDRVVQTGYEMKLRAYPLADLLRKHNAPPVIEYAAFDIEGSELEVLSSFPFGEYRFRALTLECDGRIWDGVTQVLTSHDYREVKNPLNEKAPWERYFLHATTPDGQAA